jgi:multisubunit Na+/H+ antiporter MnhB subunit
MTADRDDRLAGLWLRGGLALLLANVALGVSISLFTAPASEGLEAIVRANLHQAGAENAVTAVLLNFRGYDTLLEIAVLTVTLFGVWSLGPAPRARPATPSPVLVGLNSVLIPIVPLVCGYLLWVGAYEPGGAFQAGAVLAAAGVLYILTGHQLHPWLPDAPMRWAALVGPATFLAVALAVMLTGRAFLEYPPTLAHALMLVIETTATISISMILVGLFLGGRPEKYT